MYYLLYYLFRRTSAGSKNKYNFIETLKKEKDKQEMVRIAEIVSL